MNVKILSQKQHIWIGKERLQHFKLTKIFYILFDLTKFITQYQQHYGGGGGARGQWSESKVLQGASFKLSPVLPWALALHNSYLPPGAG